MSQGESPPNRSRWTRREFIVGTTTLASAIPFAGIFAGCDDASLSPGGAFERIDPEALPTPESLIDLTLRVNGTDHAVQIEPRLTLNAVLRERIGLTGTKLSCDRAACGACTVHIDGTAVLSCTMLAVEAEGRDVETIEGIADGDDLHPLQDAFIAQDAMQCGFCTPGMIMACKALLDRNLNPTEDDVRQATAGNLCRCGTYPRVFAAALQAAETLRGG